MPICRMAGRGSKIQVIKPCVAQQNDDGSIVMEGFSKDYGCTTYNFLIVNQTYNPRYTPYYDGSVRYQTITHGRCLAQQDYADQRTR